MSKSTEYNYNSKKADPILRINDDSELQNEIVFNKIIISIPNSELSMTQKVLLCIVCQICEENHGYCVSTGKYIGERVGLGIQAVNKQLNALKEKGYLKWPMPKLYRRDNGSTYKIRKVRPTVKTLNIMSSPSIRSYTYSTYGTIKKNVVKKSSSKSSSSGPSWGIEV
jgi:hypothetical protein